MIVAANCPLYHVRQDAQFTTVANVDGCVRGMVQCPTCQLVWALPRTRRTHSVKEIRNADHSL